MDVGGNGGNPMQRPTYIDRRTQATVRSNAISYISVDVPENVTLDEYGRRAVGERAKRYSSLLRRTASRVGYTSSTETTAGGW